YSAGVGEPGKALDSDVRDVVGYTRQGDTDAVVSNGPADLGLGDIGRDGSLIDLEGQPVSFIHYACVGVFHVCLNTSNIDDIVETVKRLEPTFGGINLEDIAAPDCFIIEEQLKKEMRIPIFHDDQHGTAIVTVAGLLNALKLTKKSFKNIKVVANGAGAAGMAIIKMLENFGVSNIIMCDSQGAIYEGRPRRMNNVKEVVAKKTNPHKLKGSLEEVIEGADVFIGVSVG